MAIINDADLLVVQRGGENYTYSGAELKDDMRLYGSGGSAPTPTLAEVCAENRDAGAYTPIFQGIQANNNITAGGKIEAVSELKGPSGHRIVNDGGIFSPHTVNVSTSGDVIRPLYIGTSNGLFRANAGRSADEITAATSVDTSNFLGILDKVDVLKYEDGQYGIKPTTLYSDSNARFLTYDKSEVNPINVPIYLMAVCKQQQQLIENLTTRIEQLEADHASAMNNMEDDNGSSTY